MIKSIRLTNFFSFANQTIRLADLNVLIGINGAGKSNLLKAVSLLRALVVEGGLSDLMLNQWGGYDAVCFSGTTDLRYIELEYEFDYKILGSYGYKFQEPVYYCIRLCRVGSSQNYAVKESFHTKNDRGKRKYVYFEMNNGKGFVREGKTDDQQMVEYAFENAADSVLTQLVDKDRFYQIHTLRDALRDISIYSYFDTTPTSSIRKPALPGSTLKLSHDGANLPQLLNAIKISRKSEFHHIISSISSINPKFRGFDFNIIGNNIELLLDEEGLERSVHITNVSDGTLHYMCLLAILCNSKRGGLVCIDEPELGLHPDMLAEIVEQVNDTCNDTQYIIATHSQQLLNHVTVDKLIVIEKDESNSSTVTTFHEEDFKLWASQYSTGTLWRNGDLGGNRY